MTYVITAECIDELDGSCVDCCPVDCIYEGERKRYIHPGECIDRGACLPECPVDAILAPGDAPEPLWAADNAAFFTQTLPGRDAPLGECPARRAWRRGAARARRRGHPAGRWLG